MQHLVLDPTEADVLIDALEEFATARRERARILREALGNVLDQHAAERHEADAETAQKVLERLDASG